MSKARFEIAFEGEPFEGGVIDVRDLAPTLLAFGSVVQSANRSLNGERAEASLKLVAGDEGSFVAQLVVDVSWLADMLDAVAANPDRVVAADQLVSLLVKAGGALGTGVVGVLGAIKFLRGRKPDAVELRGDGTTNITINATTIQVDDRAVKLLKDRPTREAVEDLGRKAASVEGLDRFLIGDREDEEQQVSLERRDLPSLDVPEDEETPEPEVSHRETWLQIISSHFRDGYKWRFSDGGERPFTAVMEDEAFQKRVQEADISLAANDAIKCRLREEQTISGSGLAKSVFVEEVLDHRPGAQQMELL